MTKRKCRWVLYRFRDLYEIIEDSKSPISTLESLDHCLGVYESYQLAFGFARKAIVRRTADLGDNLRVLRERCAVERTDRF